MMPADANDSGSHDRSASDSGRKPPSPSSKTSTASSPSTSTPPPQSSIWRRSSPDRASSTRPRCFMPRRSVSNDASRSGRAGEQQRDPHQVSGVWISRDPSLACPSPQQPGWQSRCTSIWRRGVAIRASERMASTAFRKAASWPFSSAGKRSSTLWLSRRPAAISTPSASSQGAPSSTAAGHVRARRSRSRRSPAPKGRGRAGTHARPDGSARRRPRIRRGPTPARAAAARGASGTAPGRGPAARRRASAPAARRLPGRGAASSHVGSC